MAPTTASSTGEHGGRFDKVVDGDKQGYPHLIHCPHGCQKAPVTLHEWLGGPLPASTERRSQFVSTSATTGLDELAPMHGDLHVLCLELHVDTANFGCTFALLVVFSACA
jgi:hypothetical protein